VLVDGEVLESDPPHRLVHTWRALYDPETASEPHSRVSWEIEPQDGGFTKLTVVHDRLEEAPKTALSVAGGWSFVLSGLKTLLETGKPLAGSRTVRPRVAAQQGAGSARALRTWGDARLCSRNKTEPIAPQASFPAVTRVCPLTWPA
jgi:hypothetical protein